LKGQVPHTHPISLITSLLDVFNVILVENAVSSSANRLMLKQSLDQYNDSFRIEPFGETEAGSAGEQPARDSQTQNEWEC